MGRLRLGLSGSLFLLLVILISTTLVFAREGVRKMKGYVEPDEGLMHPPEDEDYRSAIGAHDYDEKSWGHQTSQIAEDGTIIDRGETNTAEFHEMKPAVDVLSHRMNYLEQRITELLAAEELLHQSHKEGVREEDKKLEIFAQLEEAHHLLEALRFEGNDKNPCDALIHDQAHTRQQLSELGPQLQRHEEQAAQDGIGLEKFLNHPTGKSLAQRFDEMRHLEETTNELLQECDSLRQKLTMELEPKLYHAAEIVQAPHMHPDHTIFDKEGDADQVEGNTEL